VAVGPISDEARELFTDLYQNFTTAYALSSQGKAHAEAYINAPKQAVQNFRAIVAAADAQQDVTESVLLKLLPYANSQPNQDKGAWIHFAPSITGDVKSWFERAGWTKAEDWPQVARAGMRWLDPDHSSIAPPIARRCLRKVSDESALRWARY
jgi:5-methylcytosine-specific restriction enzyme B